MLTLHKKKTLILLVLMFIAYLPLVAPPIANGQNAGGRDNLKYFFDEAEKAEGRVYSKNHITLTYVSLKDNAQDVIVDPGRAYQRLHLGAPSVGIEGDPSVVHWGNTETEFMVFVRGTDNALWYADASGDWHTLKGVITESPDAAIIDGKVSVFVRWTNNEIYYRTYDFESEMWADWETIGGPMFGADSAPAAFGWENEPDDYILGGVLVKRTVGTLAWILLTRDGWTTWTNIVGPYVIKPNTDPEVTTANYLNMMIITQGVDDIFYTLHINVAFQGGWRAVRDTDTSYDPAIVMFSSEWFRVIHTFINDDRLLEITCQTTVRACGNNINWANRGAYSGPDAYAWGAE